jgi:centrosomal protein CEP135
MNIFYKILFQNIQERNAVGKSDLEKTIEHLTYINHQVIY